MRRPVAIPGRVRRRRGCDRGGVELGGADPADHVRRRGGDLSVTTGDVWQQLLSSALVGVDKRRVTLSGVDGPLATVLAPGDLDPDAVLDAAAAVTLARRGGLTAVKGIERVSAPADT